MYVLQAFVGSADLLRHHLDASHLARLVTLQQGFGMIPMTDAVRADLQAGSVVKEEAYPDGLYYLSAPIVAWAERISRDGPVAYVEADFFSGKGVQAALVWREGGLLLGPLVTSNEPAAGGEPSTSLPLEQWAINRALRLLGVSSHGARDEFDALGLGAHRNTDDWLQR